MDRIELDWSDFKTNIDSYSFHYYFLEKSTVYEIFASNGPILLFCKLDKEQASDFEQNYKSNAHQSFSKRDENGNEIQFSYKAPFADKELSDGSKLFRRKHGVRSTIPAFLDGTESGERNIDLVIPYQMCKINKVEIIGANNLDLIDLKVLDDSAGFYSGSGIQNVQLNQFAYDVVVSDWLYSDKSDYDAELYYGMVVRCVYKNKGSTEAKIGVNFVIHEVVSP